MIIIKSKIEQRKAGGLAPTKYDEPERQEWGISVEEQYARKRIILSLIIVMSVITHNFVKGNADEFSTQLTKFSNSLNGLVGPTPLAIKYGYSTAQLLSIKNDALAFAYFVLKHGAGATYSTSWTSVGDELRSGTGAISPTWPMGDPLTVPAPPSTSVLPGIETRFRADAKFAKDQTQYIVADGITMGIEVVSSPFVPGEGLPDLEGKIGDGGHPLLKYTKSKYQGVNIYKNSNDGKGFVFSHTVNDPTYTDYAALPPVGVSAVWVYRAFYLYKGQEVGTVSKDVSVTVTGLVVTE
jgi:hypothetical protein